MEDPRNELYFKVSYRGKILQLTCPSESTVGELGQKLVELTGVAPHTLKLMLPKRLPLQPMSSGHRSVPLQQSGITEGLTVRMMGSSTAEVATVQQGSKDRIRGFAEEEELARQRASSASGPNPLPAGNYIFCDFRTLTLPGIELNPPPSLALKIMHKLASDRGITAIMNKHRWRVGVMTEMAPVGYVGISETCVLGYNRNRGQEISLRLRTDDLKGFRKYESIKKTLLHELAHMVHDAHDEKFHALDKQLNEEAIALDWTKSHGHTWSGAKFEEEEDAMDTGGVHTSRGYRLGGENNQLRYMDPRAAAAAAALRRHAASTSTSSAAGDVNGVRSASEPSVGIKRVRHAEPDPDDLDESIAVIAEGCERKQEPDPDDAMEVVLCHPRENEPDPDESMDMDPSGAEPKSHEVEVAMRSNELDQTDHNEVMAQRAEPDPDDHSEEPSRTAEPDPDDHVEQLSRAAEPDPDDRCEERTSAAEPDPDDHKERLIRAAEPDPDDQDDKVPSSSEPDPDESGRACCKRQADKRNLACEGRVYKQSCSF